MLRKSFIRYFIFYASPSSGEAYWDRQLTTNFELKFFVCRHVSMRIPKPCIDVCPYPEKRNRPITPTLVIDRSMERSSRVLHHGNPKIWFFFSKKFEFWLVTKSWNHLSFVNISPTLVISSKLNFDSSIQVGLNKHLYDDIGDASSSLRGSTSSLRLYEILLSLMFVFMKALEGALHYTLLCHLPLEQ